MEPEFVDCCSKLPAYSNKSVEDVKAGLRNFSLTQSIIRLSNSILPVQEILPDISPSIDHQVPFRQSNPIIIISSDDEEDENSPAVPPKCDRKLDRTTDHTKVAKRYAVRRAFKRRRFLEKQQMKWREDELLKLTNCSILLNKNEKKVIAGIKKEALKEMAERYKCIG